MTNYRFETDQFGVSDKGFHLLRSRYNYKTIEFASIYSLSFAKGRQVNNWLLLWIFGLALSFFGFYTAVKVIYEYFFADNIHRFFIAQFVLPVIPIFIGTYALYFSFKTGPVLIVNYDKKKKRLPINQLKTQSNYNEFISFLSNHDLMMGKVHFNHR